MEFFLLEADWHFKSNLQASNHKLIFSLQQQELSGGAALEQWLSLQTIGNYRFFSLHVRSPTDFSAPAVNQESTSSICIAHSIMPLTILTNWNAQHHRHYNGDVTLSIAHAHLSWTVADYCCTNWVQDIGGKGPHSTRVRRAIAAEGVTRKHKNQERDN